MPKEIYCRELKGGSLDIDRAVHYQLGHAPHFFTHKRFFFSKPEKYHCPGVKHEHSYYKTLGVVFMPLNGTHVVERCMCGAERTRPIDKRA